MKLRWKKQIFNIYTLSVILALPIISFLYLGFDTGMLPRFWKHIDGINNAILGEDPWVVAYMRLHISFVDAMEWYVSYGKHLIPILSSVAVLPFIQMRDRFLPFATPRMKHPRKTERLWVIRATVIAGCTVFCAYLATMLVMRIWCISTYDANNCLNVFVNEWGWNLNAAVHPYLYVLLLGVFRYFLLPMMFSLLTIAISYLINKVYIYLLVPTIYGLIATSFFSQGLYKDRWPFPLFSPENLLWPSSPEYWGYGHTVHGIWGVVGAMAIVILPSIVMIWYGMRRRRA